MHFLQYFHFSWCPTLSFYWFLSCSDSHVLQPIFYRFFRCGLFNCTSIAETLSFSPTPWVPPLVLSFLFLSDPALALRIFPNHRLQWASSHRMGPAFGHKINRTASRQGVQPISHLFCWIVRDKGYPEVVLTRPWATVPFCFIWTVSCW